MWKTGQKFTAEDGPDRTKMAHAVPGFVRRDPAEQRGKLKVTHLDVRAGASNPEATMAVVVESVLSAKDCQALIAMANAKGFTPALMNSGGGRQVYFPQHRRGWRCIIDCPALAAYLLEVLRPVLPAAFRPGRGHGAGHDHDHELVGLNERCRYLFYEQGQQFEAHYDGCYTRPKGHPTERNGRSCSSRLTLQLYLNERRPSGERRRTRPPPSTCCLASLLSTF